MNKMDKVINEMIPEMVERLLSQATPEEADLYCRIQEATEKECIEVLGETKETLTKLFLIQWMQRANEETL